MGSVGFMAELESSELYLLDKIVTGDFTVEERMMLDVKVWRDDEVVYSDTAFNDVLINKAAAARLIQLSVFSGAEGESTLAAFSGDGVILSTPTGSTAIRCPPGGPSWSPPRRTSS
jgi:NAD+ kinase